MSQSSETFTLQDARCAGCILKIERYLSTLPGIDFARGNATQRRVRVVWDEAQHSVESLIGEIKGLGYSAAPVAESTSLSKEPSLLPRLAVAAIATMNIMAFSMSVWFGQATDMGPGTVQFMHWVSGAVAVPVLLYSADVFYKPAWRALRRGHMTMDTPISLAILITFVSSAIETYRGSEHVYFDAVVSLVFLLLIGRVLEQLMRRRSDDVAGNLRELTKVCTNRLDEDGNFVRTDAEDLRSGDRVMIHVGDVIPADGVLHAGHADIDESNLTGETAPRRVRPGDPLAAGTLLLSGPVEMNVTGVGDASQIGQMVKAVEDVVAHKGRMQELSDQFARSYIPLVLVGSAFGFFLWVLAFNASAAEALQIAIAVLIVTCPCAAGLATPAVASRAVNLAMKSGIVVKSGQALEALARIDDIFLDKTGTASQPCIGALETFDPEVLRDAQSLASGSKHPLSHALAKGAHAQPTQGLVERPGEGISAATGARLGSAEFVGLTARNDGSLFHRDTEGTVTPIPVAETPRAGLAELLSFADARGFKVTLLSGDQEAAVRDFSELTGIRHWLANQTPGDKLNLALAADQRNRTVLMIGDGVNDSAALSGAQVSASFAGATGLAQTAADVVLSKPDLSQIPKAIKIAERAQKLIKQNLAFATIYNVVTVPLALAGWLTPAIAALLMSSSSIVVLANGLRLRSEQ